MHQRKAFPLGLYVLFVFALSWPFLLAARWLVDRYTSGHSFNTTTLLIVPLGIPTFTFHTDRKISSIVRLLALGLAALVPALCAEFGWRGYLLPNLLQYVSPRRAILLHSLIWWVWFLPSTLGVAAYAGFGASAQALAPCFVSVPAAIALVLLATLIPVVCQGVILSYFRLTSGGILVPAAYYTFFECVRDSLGSNKSLAPLAVGMWANAVIIGAGLLMFWQVDW